VADQLLTVPQVADEFQVTPQTIRNWIDSGVLPAIRVGRAFRLRRDDVDAVLTRASADSNSLATRRDLWAPDASRLPSRRSWRSTPSIWDAGEATRLPLKRR
jgi:excisionase family DNA binding protein